MSLARSIPILVLIALTASTAACTTFDGLSVDGAALVGQGDSNQTSRAADCAGGACDPGKGCASGAECESKVCNAGTCVAATPGDGVMNATETDVDCGGGAPAPACGADKHCSDGPRDCESQVCTGGTCKAATSTDGIRNGDESDVDCGGTTTGAPKCSEGKLCKAHADCSKDGCGFDGRCALGRSCTKKLGGATCGTGEVGDPAAVHESCCATAPLGGSTATIDKYHVTAGRMRTFIERVNGDARTFASGSPGWNASWSPYVPSTIAEADDFLGPFWTSASNQNDGDPVSKRSCNPDGFGGRTYWTAAGNGGAASDYTKDQLDPKALNCVGWHLAKAFCAWDGGRLATSAEIRNAFTNQSTTTFPWDWQHPEGWNQNNIDARVAHQFSYGFPGTPRMVGGVVQDVAWFIAPPGRFPEGRNKNGVQDVAGNLLQYVNDGEYAFSWTASWERHEANLKVENWKGIAGEAPNGYYALGFRCAHD